MGAERGFPSLEIVMSLPLASPSRLSSLGLVSAFLLGVAAAFATSKLPVGPAPASAPLPAVVQGHEVPASALAGETRAVDRIFILEHEKHALALALAALEAQRAPEAGDTQAEARAGGRSGLPGSGILPSLPTRGTFR